MIQSVFRAFQGPGSSKPGGAKELLKFFLCAAIPAASQRTGNAQVQTINCGGLNDHAFGFFETEFWAGNSGFCDPGLKPSNGSFKAFLGDGGVCVNDNRQTAPNAGGWIGWAVTRQRTGIQKDLPIKTPKRTGNFTVVEFNIGPKGSLDSPKYVQESIRRQHNSRHFNRLNAQTGDQYDSGYFQCPSLQIARRLNAYQPPSDALGNLPRLRK